MTKENLNRKKNIYVATALLALSMGAGIYRSNQQSKVKEDTYITYVDGEEEPAKISDMETSEMRLYLYKNNETGEMIYYDHLKDNENYTFVGEKVVAKTKSLRK